MLAIAHPHTQPLRPRGGTAVGTLRLCVLHNESGVAFHPRGMRLSASGSFFNAKTSRFASPMGRAGEPA
jgi:hypothetical protein